MLLEKDTIDGTYTEKILKLKLYSPIRLKLS